MARAREYLCQWGNCHEESASLPVVVTYRVSRSDFERHHFCCLEHAALWCAKHAGRRTGKELELTE